MSRSKKINYPSKNTRKTSKESYLIESLKKVVDVITKAFGSRCEVVLHDLRDPEHSIVKIANGHVTGRTVGGPITDLGLSYLRSAGEMELPVNYLSETKDGRTLKSTTVVFKNDKRKPFAALCVNFDMTDIFYINTVIKDIFILPEDAEKTGTAERFELDKVSTLEGIADEAIKGMGKMAPVMGKEDKVEIVKKLDKQGFFLIKGAIKILAGKLKVSQYTIYNYLKQI